MVCLTKSNIVFIYFLSLLSLSGNISDQISSWLTESVKEWRAMVFEACLAASVVPQLMMKYALVHLLWSRPISSCSLVLLQRGITSRYDSSWNMKLHNWVLHWLLAELWIPVPQENSHVARMKKHYSYELSVLVFSIKNNFCHRLYRYIYTMHILFIFWEHDKETI